MKIKHQFTDLHKDSKKRSKICLLCASLCMFTFTGGYAQTGKVSLNLNNASVKELFTAIEKQTPYRFSYRDVEVNGKTGISLWGIERSGFFNGREKWAKGFENQRV